LLTRRRIALAGLAAALALALPAASAQAVSKSFWGVQYNSPTTSQDFNMMQGAKVGTARFVIWHSFVQADGFAQYDAVIGGLASRGVAGLPDLLNNPADYTPPISGSAAQSWTQFAHDVVARYGPGGSYWSGPYQSQFPGAAIKPVTSWQVGNEPSLPKYWPTSSKAQDYAKFLKISHDAIKGVDPNATIVLAGLPGIVVKAPYRGWKFLNQLYNVAGVKRNFDVAAFHPYAHHVDDIPPQMKKFRGVMRSHGDKSSKVWITEFGYGSDPPNGRLNRGPTGQANMLRKTYKLFLERRRRWNLRGLVWYEWRDPAQKNPDCSFCSSAGLLYPNFTPKPAFSAYKHFTGAGP
jgi:hypothetical protein